MRVPKHLLPYLILSLFHLAASLMGQEMLRYASKPFLMPALAFYFYHSVPKTPLNRFVLGALLFSFLGDTLLIFTSQHDIFFILGLTTFLMAHLIYIVINMNTMEQSGKGFKLQWQDVPFFLFGLVVFSIVKKDLGDMYFPALGYTVIICIMTLTARKRWKKTDTKSFWLIMIGALLFLTSDSFLAINKFMEPIQGADFIIMSTYLVAQFLLIEGLIVFINRLKVEPESNTDSDIDLAKD